MSTQPAADSAAPGSGELSLDAAVVLAFEQYRAGNTPTAAELCRRVLAIAPRQVDALHLLGIARFAQEAEDEGIALVRQAAELAPDHADIHNNLGNLLLHAARPAEAAQSYRRALALRPMHAGAHANFGLAMRDAIAIDPDAPGPWINLGQLLHMLGRHDEAVPALTRAVEIYGGARTAQRLLGQSLYRIGRVHEAAAVYRRWLHEAPDNPTARHLLAACSGQDVPERAPEDYLRDLYRDFANDFDTNLAQLDYQAPALIVAAIDSVAGLHRVGVAADLGCGTGLLGARLRERTALLTGVDLSPEMLAKARARGCYDALVESELIAFLGTRKAAFDLLTAADVLCYCGALEDFASGCAHALRPGGVLAFSVEAAPDDAPTYHLGPSGRYSHAPGYVRDTLGNAGFQVLDIQAQRLRNEGGAPVPGWVAVARKPAAAQGAP